MHFIRDTQTHARTQHDAIDTRPRRLQNARAHQAAPPLPKPAHRIVSAMHCTAAG
ncbi:uncharacterized protein B0I36DRAFT_320996 [Microdochium trichocladiopsis]|uniref:Uncharacterized protein n=1 Tax=Microdochium trichocladiopsis TaxID=1682393 RepID=A0A9P8YBM3_9PEZI|nr:uncharacterized protein B0I36DRAFT_320996 [Microdochium trichocladiopsis]KAH7033217.1 hypothetical protein B0I36DRAFT_320996 [Microdochium trichocladiopsis]